MRPNETQMSLSVQRCLQTFLDVNHETKRNRWTKESRRGQKSCVTIPYKGGGEKCSLKNHIIRGKQMQGGKANAWGITVPDKKTVIVDVVIVS
jgi:hypothetical protein